MLKYTLAVLLFVLPKVAWCLADTLKIANTGNLSERTVGLKLQVNSNLKDGCTFTISSQEDSITVSLFGKAIKNDTLFLMQDNSQEARNRIYGLLGCEEADLKTKYYTPDPRFGTDVVNHLINRIYSLPNHQSSLVISPIAVADEPVASSSGFFTKEMLWGIIGILVLTIGLLTYLYLMAKKKTTSTSDDPLKDKINEIKSELGMRGNYSDLSALDALLNKYFDSIKLGKDYEELSRELESTKQSHQRALQEIETQNSQEKEYLTAILNEYVRPFIVHFKDDTDYPANRETQQKLVENLLPLAFHFMSYVKHKNGVSNEQDMLNLQQFRNPQIHSLLKTIDFSANTTNTDNKLVLHIIDVLKQYEVNELKNVNINGYIIKNDSSK
ncbi:hypothetical protein GCM10027035_10640 [Emticicia sediminis]